MDAPSMEQVRAQHLWQTLRQWFETDDGSLPDIFVDGLSGQEVAHIYDWLRQRSALPPVARAWHLDKQCDVSLHDMLDPVAELQAGRIEPFNHMLTGLVVSGVALPLLAVFVDPRALQFDYRKGHEWNETTLLALFVMLRQIQQFAPAARIWHAEEGQSAMPTAEFSAVLGTDFGRCLDR